MTVAWGCDVSARPLPAPAALLGHNPPLRFAISYISSPGGIAKDWTRAEVDEYRAAGIAVGLVFEDAEQDYLAGYSGGAAKARIAADRLDMLGLNDATGVVYCAYDSGIVDSERTVVVDYQRGWNAVLGADGRGAYGNNRVMRWLFDADLIDYGWEMQWATPGVWDPRSQLRQHGRITVGGTAVDVDEAMAPDWGQWRWDAMTTADAAGVNQHTDSALADMYRALARGEIDGKIDPAHRPQSVAGVYDRVGAVLAAVDRLASGPGLALADDVRSVLAALGTVRQAIGPAADRDAAILAAIAALPTRLDAGQVAELAAALHLDADAVAVAVAHRVTVTLGTAAP